MFTPTLVHRQNRMSPIKRVDFQYNYLFDQDSARLISRFTEYCYGRLLFVTYLPMFPYLPVT